MNSKIIIILIAGISLIGCTTMRPIDTRKADLTEQLKVGDYVVIYQKSGGSVRMTIDTIDAYTLQGTLGKKGGRFVQVDISNIETIERERIAVAKTTGAILGGIVLLPVAVLGVAMSGGGY